MELDLISIVQGLEIGSCPWFNIFFRILYTYFFKNLTNTPFLREIKGTLASEILQDCAQGLVR